jgi:hypothetical protein
MIMLSSSSSSSLSRIIHHATLTLLLWITTNTTKVVLLLLVVQVLLTNQLSHSFILKTTPTGIPTRTKPTTTTTLSIPPPPLPSLFSTTSLLISSSSTPSSTSYRITQVISDIDDTIKSSGGVNVGGITLGGIDVQYKRGLLYPGVAEFMLQISIGMNSMIQSSPSSTKSNNKKQQQSSQQQQLQQVQQSSSSFVPAKIAVLTARAEELKVALELKNNHPISIAFENAALRQNIYGWGIGPVLYGSVVEWVIQDRKGLRKFTNFERLIDQQDPTGTILQYIYVGDTGELDQQAGETMLREYPELVQAVFLHVVSSYDYIDDDNSSTTTATTTTTTTTNNNAATGTATNDNNIGRIMITIPPPKLINGRPIIFFRTYVGAAIAAVQLGLMSINGLEIVMDAACEQLQNVPKTSSKWIDLNFDLDRADELLFS